MNRDRDRKMVDRNMTKASMILIPIILTSPLIALAQQVHDPVLPPISRLAAVREAHIV